MRQYELNKSTGELIWTYDFTLPICFEEDFDNKDKE
jgi:outer membrane protein assembly factor BamB